MLVVMEDVGGGDGRHDGVVVEENEEERRGIKVILPLPSFIKGKRVILDVIC